MLSSEDYYREFPYMAVFAARAIRPPNRGGYQPPLVQGSVGMNTYGAPIYSNTQSYVLMENNTNKLPPYKSGLHQFDRDVTPALRQQVKVCSQQTHNPVGCNISAIESAMELAHRGHH